MIRRGWSKVAFAKTVILNLTDGSAIRGALIKEHRSLIVLSGAELLAESGKDLPSPVKMDGETVIDSDKIRFAQMI